MSLFQKQETEEPELVGLIDFTDSAKSLTVGGDMNKRIYLVFNWRLTGKTYDYNEFNIRKLEERGIPVVDATEGMFVSGLKKPSSKIILGSLQLRKIMG